MLCQQCFAVSAESRWVADLVSSVVQLREVHPRLSPTRSQACFPVPLVPTELAGIGAGILGFLETPRYIYSILSGKTIPHALTWVSMAIFNSTFLIMYDQKGAEDTIWVPFGDAVGYIAIAVVSIATCGEWKRPSPLDALSFFGAMGSLAFFHVYDGALLLVLATLLALLPTINKTWVEPTHEDLFSWSITVAASALNLCAVTRQVEGPYVASVLAIDLTILLLALRRYSRTLPVRSGNR